MPSAMGKTQRWARRLLGFGLAFVCTSAIVLAGTHQRGSSHVVLKHEYPGDYIGPVWITVLNPPSERAQVVVRWGSVSRRMTIEPGGPTSYSFLKTQLTLQDNRPVFVESDHQLQVSFGFGLLPPKDAVVSDDGWVDSKLVAGLN